MKKSFLIALTFFGLALGSVNAQSCCTIAKEKCKPKICCPATPNCCVDEGADAEATITQKNANAVSAKAPQNEKSEAIENEVLIIEN